MEYLQDLPAYWSNLNHRELLAIPWIGLLVLFTITSNYLFVKFIESKPIGRKTVIGKIL